MRFWIGLLCVLVAVPVCADSVVLLHGIARSGASLGKMEKALQKQGYEVVNITYPSRHQDIAAIVQTISPTITGLSQRTSGTLHIVTHSMGGLVARAYLAAYRPANLGRVVMLAPPNGGSEVADMLAGTALYTSYFGPAGAQLVTSRTDALSKLLGEVDYPVGIIAGNRSVYPVESVLWLPGEDDGRVTVSRTHVAGEAGHIVLPVNHPLMMNDAAVISQTLHFLQHSRFVKN